MEYEAVIGLEVHAELKTESKLFCGCSTKFGSEPNTQTCPVCLGLPGVLPVLNEKALEYTIKAGLALGSEIPSFSKFDRKNYFYPDLPKDYQVSQFDKPFCVGGKVEIWIDDTRKTIGLTRAHLEEEAGKLNHYESESGVDFNRTGVPLLEIVSEPEMSTPDEAYQFLVELKQILEYIEISDCNMEEGSLRCDANVSIRPKGARELGVKVEVKNMNSFNGVRKALAYEIERLEDLARDGEKIVQETRRWDADKQMTFSMRSKEEAHDYRYFPEPDLVPVEMDRDQVNRIAEQIPELPLKRRERFMREYQLSQYDAGVLTAQKEFAKYFESCCKLCDNYKVVANWIMGDFSRELNENKIDIDECRITPRMLTDMINLIDSGKISGKIAKTVFNKMFETGKDPEEIIENEGLVQISDTSELEAIIDKIIEQNQSSVADFKAGKQKALGHLVGQVMRETRGKANPQMVNQLLVQKLSG
jgi:aspartyl-tRNA(Asn)/glutamyl-tRNA(Gln) amidotransferase subunit B